MMLDGVVAVGNKAIEAYREWLQAYRERTDAVRAASVVSVLTLFGDTEAMGDTERGRRVRLYLLRLLHAEFADRAMAGEEPPTEADAQRGGEVCYAAWVQARHALTGSVTRAQTWSELSAESRAMWSRAAWEAHKSHREASKKRPA